MSAKEAAIFNAAKQICDEWDEIWGVGQNGRASEERVSEIISAHLHPADDGESVTVEWLESIGFWKSKAGGVAIEIGCDAALLRYQDGGLFLWNDDARFDLPSVTTRGQLRRLLDALGVEAKEGGR